MGTNITKRLAGKVALVTGGLEQAGPPKPPKKETSS